MSKSQIEIVIPGDDPVQIAGSPQLERLGQHGRVSLYTSRPADDLEKVRRAQHATCLINSRGIVKWPGVVLGQLTNLKMISVCGIGTDSIDLEAARELGITVCNLPGRTAPVVAEHAFALMFAVAKRLAFQTAELKAGRWSGMSSTTLAGKTVGLVGAGPIAGHFARLARGVGMRTLAWTFHPSSERAERLGVEFCSLDDLLSQSDVVSLHLPLTDRSRYLIGSRELALMRPGSILINTARGAVVQECALVAALQSGHLAGAGLDVFETEPLVPQNPLLQCEHVVLTPHCADQTPEGIELLNSGVVDNVLAYLRGEPQNVVV